MNSTENRFRHDLSPYERPTLGWYCGRETPCMHGPTADGNCGGEATCAPARTGASWNCKRPAAAGGPCARGPQANGRCGLIQPPCVPRRSLRVWRGRLTLLAVGITAALLAVLALKPEGFSYPQTSMDAGPLSSAHAQFVGASNCSSCHAAFGKGAVAWWDAFRRPAATPTTVQTEATTVAHGLSTACTSCHGFGNRDDRAHNGLFERADQKSTTCLNCHTEHKGRHASITKLTQNQCQSCHLKTISSFANAHPPFGADYPYDHARALRFDHAAHLGKHFAAPASSGKAPAGCVSCHTVGENDRAIRPADFARTCSACHSDGIAKRDMVLLRWPEILKNSVTPEELRDACGLQDTPQDGASFSAVSADPLNALAAFLLNVSADAPDEYQVQVQDLVKEMMRNGADPLQKLSRDRLASAERAMTGLNPEQVRQAACAWGANKDYVPPGSQALPGWRADGLELRYASPSHADGVLRAWIESIVAAPIPSDAEQAQRLQAVKDELLSTTEGAGQCMKCHTVSASTPPSVNWRVSLRSATPLTRFNHRPHLDLLGPEKTCTSCHRLADGPTSAANGLKPIGLDTCTSCHTAGKARDDCRTCHVYHQNHALKKGMIRDAN